jgi:hypothetical protein
MTVPLLTPASSNPSTAHPHQVPLLSLNFANRVKPSTTIACPALPAVAEAELHIPSLSEWGSEASASPHQARAAQSYRSFAGPGHDHSADSYGPDDMRSSRSYKHRAQAALTPSTSMGSDQPLLLDIPESAAAEAAAEAGSPCSTPASASRAHDTLQLPPAADHTVVAAEVQEPQRSGSGQAKGTTSVASTSSLVRNKRSAEGHKRLLVAIGNDNGRTMHQMRLMNIASVAMIIIVLALNVTLFLIANNYIDQSSVLTENIFVSSKRQGYLIDVVTNLRIFKALAFAPGDVALSSAFYMPNVHASDSYADVYDYFYYRIQVALNTFVANSDEVDSTPTTSTALEKLRNEDSFEVTYLNNDGTTRTVPINLRYAALQESALARWIPRAMLSVPEDEDFMYFAVMSIGSGGLRAAVQQNTVYIIEEQEALHAELVVIAGVILACSITAVVIVLFFFIRPLVLRIEASKSQVLLVFQSVPYSMRKSLRKKAYGVYKLTRRDGDDGINRRMDDDDEDRDKQSGAASQAGSEWTSYTKYSDAASAAFLRRYNKPPSAASVPTAAPIAAPNARHSARGRDNSGRQQRSTMAEEAITSARISGSRATSPLVNASANAPMILTTSAVRAPTPTGAEAPTAIGAEDDSEDDANAPEQEQEGSIHSARSVSPARGSTTSAKRLLEETTIEMTHMARPQSEMTAGSHGSGGSMRKEDLSDEDRLRMQLEGEKSMLARKAMAILLSKYVFFVLTIALYFGLSIWQIKTQLGTVEGASRLTAVASLRSPAIEFSFYQARQFLFFKWDDVKDNPSDATIVSGNYRDSAFTELDIAQKSTRAAIYGDETYEIGMPDGNKDQDYILSGDLCEIPLETFRSLVPTVPDHVVTKCKDIENGLLQHGLYGAMDFAFEKLTAFLDPINEAGVMSYLPTPPGLTVADTEQLLTELQRTSVIVNEYIFYYLALSAAVYNASAQAVYTDFRSILIIFLVVFSLFLGGTYFALFHPISTALLRASNSTKSMMLLLPPEVIKHVPAAQRYIDENVSNE